VINCGRLCRRGRLLGDRFLPRCACGALRAPRVRYVREPPAARGTTRTAVPHHTVRMVSLFPSFNVAMLVLSRVVDSGFSTGAAGVGTTQGLR